MQKNGSDQVALDNEVYDRSNNTIFLKQGRISEVVSAIGESLSDSGQNVFVYGDRLVEVIERKKSDKGIDRPDGALMIHAVESNNLVEKIGRSCAVAKWDGRSGGYVPTDCPKRVADIYMSRGYWPELPDLIGFTEAPFIDLDGRLVNTPGYDDKTQIYLTLSPFLSGMVMPKKSTLELARISIRALQAHLSEFAFVESEGGSKPDESGAIAAIMTVLQRRVLESAPAFAISATAAGTGKTTLAEVCSIIATGRRPAVASLGDDASETEKRIQGMLMAGENPIVLDNITTKIGDEPVINQALSQPRLIFRPLGASSMINIPTNATMFLTGNSLSVVGDMRRRTVLIRMDAKQENPEKRRFKSNIIESTIKQRGKLIAAALTIIMAYIEAGEPEPDGWNPVGSFDQWDRLIRRPLMWAGLPDPLLSSQALKDIDPDIEGIRMMFDAWRKAFDPINLYPLKVSSIIEKADSSEPGAAQLKDALNFITWEKISSKRVAGWLRSNRDRIVDGYRITMAGHDSVSGVGLWKLVRCE